jgi:cysteinyl-tRNA synthetase
LEPFVPVQEGKVGLYTCGPTVYNYAHIGNLRTYILEDLIRRTFEAHGYDVRHVMNVTDVGHLESDADAGEDKLELAARRERHSPWEIARFYEAAFFEDCRKLGLEPPHVVCRATEHIPDMIDFIHRIEERGFSYIADGNVYFSIDRFPGYGKLALLDLDSLRAGSRIEVDSRKENPLDFVLWFSNSKFRNQIMQWDSPWGRGFPGWHIECSAMATKYLGEYIDIHTGGIDHIPVHHTNEIAQSEACLGHQWVKYWMHCDFLLLKEAKMAKSSGQFLRLAVLEERGFEAPHYRYFCLGAHYRSPLTFSWEALDAARVAFESLKNRIVSWKIQANAPQKGGAAGDARAAEYASRFMGHLADDINVPAALGVLWEMAKDSTLLPAAKLKLALDFDRVLGLGFAAFERPAADEALQEQIQLRNDARRKKDWKTSDAIRDRLLAERGVQLMDTPTGTEWYFVPKDEAQGTAE